MASVIAENIAHIRERIERGARRAGREPKEITIVAATKTVEPRKIKEAIAAGVHTFGENYVQEAGEKAGKLSKSGDIRWHLIGHLQKNKAKDAVELFDVIETVDSFELAKELNKRAKKKIEVMLEVNLAKEKTKNGVTEEDVIDLARDISQFENISLKGLMAIPPVFENPEMSRPYFIALRRLAEKIRRENIPGIIMKELSMGMSNDYEIAVEEGATMIRIGTAIFGERQKK